MRARAVAAEALFLAVLVTLIAIPTFGLGVPRSSGDTSQGTSGNSGGTTSSGSSNGGSSSSGSSNDGGSGSGTASRRSGRPPHDGGSPAPSGSPTPTHRPAHRPTPSASPAPIPPVQTTVEATLLALPPFLLLVCLVGLVAGADDVPGQPGEPIHDVAATCSNVHVSRLASGSGLSSNPTPRHVNPKDVRLTIKIRPPVEPGGRRQIYVQQRLAQHSDNKGLYTLLAALAIMALAIAIALVVRRHRRLRGGP